MSPLRSLPHGLAALALLAGCSDVETAAATTDRLPNFFDCVRGTNGVVIAAHRGGPAVGFAENSLSAIENAYAAGVRLFEVDVSRSKDGVLFLLHDRTLQRTTTGSGAAINWDMDEIEYVQLVDRSGTRLDEAPPRLDTVLNWAVENDAILQLDRKDPVEFAQIVRAVRDAGAESHAMLISYDDSEAIEIARLAPEMMMTASLDNRGDQIALLELAGVDMRQVIAWTGTRSPNVINWFGLRERGIEVAFGTLGRPETRLDARYIADGDLSEYQDLVDQGLHILSTDEAIAVADYLTVDDRTLESCWQ